MDDRPVRLTLADDLRRSRLTVFFRALLAVPHFVWIGLWTAGAVLAAVAGWVVALALGRPPEPLHRFLAHYVRYKTHVSAYVFLAGNPFPGFIGEEGSYPVDVAVPPPGRQSRWVTGFRLVLAVPAVLLVNVLIAWGGVRGGGVAVLYGGGALFVVAFLAWFACLARGRMPQGFRDLAAYGLEYAARVDAFLLFLTDRYPSSDPRPIAGAELAPAHPVALRVEDDLRRSRLTVFFRFLLLLPHLVWGTLWALAALVAALAAWAAALVTGRVPGPLHRFLAAFVRYWTHLSAYGFLVGNPFPGFVGRSGGYPVDLELEPPETQSRWTVGFRAALAVPALVVAGALSYVLSTVAFLGWFAALVTGRMPEGLRNLGAYALRYTAQTYADRKSVV